MKKVIYAIMFTIITSMAISACSEENIRPAESGQTNDPCQFGGPGCPKN